MICSFCEQSILHTSVSFPCKHTAHLICCLENRVTLCPECNVAAHVVDLGLQQNNAAIAQLLLKIVKPVKTGWSFQRKPKFIDLMKEHAGALLATHHPIDFVQGKVTLSQLVSTYNLDTLLQHDFTLRHMDAMSEDPASTLRDLYTAYGMAPCNNAFSLQASEIKSRCSTLASLMQLSLSVEEMRSLGIGIDAFLKRGATLKELLQMPLYKDIDSCDSSFAEFSTAWEPSYEQLKTLGCTEQAIVEELTDWDFCSVPRAPPRREAEKVISTSLNLNAPGLKFNF